MKKAINFDIDTKQYEKCTGKEAPTAYAEIKKFLPQNGFEHMQGSGYLSENSIPDWKIAAVITKMSTELTWLRGCVKAMDITNVGKKFSAIDIIQEAPLKKRTIIKQNQTTNVMDNYER